MKIKRKFFIPALILVGCFFFAACGTKGESRYYYDNAAMSDASDYYVGEGFEYTSRNSSSRSMAPSVAQKGSMEAKTADGGNLNGSGSQEVVSRKVIVTASLEVQTRTFDEFLESLNAKISQFDGYVESASISGNNLYSTSRRNAYYTIRVPEEKMQQMIDSIGEIGTVTSSSYNAEDITLAYADVESRIKTLTTEQETLLGLLEKAAYLEDIIRLEERLSEVNYQLETYKSRQRTYDNKISYSTLRVNVQEVMRISTVVEPEPQTLGQRIATGFKDNMENIKAGIENFIVWFISYIVNIILFCAVVFALVFFGRKIFIKRTARCKKTAKPEVQETDETKMGNNK